MQDDEQERRKILADLMGMPLDKAVDVIGDMTVRDALRMRLQQQQSSKKQRASDAEALLPALLDQLNTSATRFATALEANVATTNTLLAVFEAHLERIEAELVSTNDKTDDATQAVIRAGEYLKAQLAVGRMGTPSAGEGFDDAPTPQELSGFEALVAALPKQTTSRKSP